MLDSADLTAVRNDLLAADFTVEAVSERLGSAALAGLGRSSSVPAERALDGADDAQADLLRLWVLQQPVPAERVSRALSSTPELIAAGLLTAQGTEIRADVELKPYADEAFSGWICSDQTPLDGRVPVPRSDFVLGASPASTTLAEIIPRRPVTTALDLGTGCGIQALHLAGHVQQIVATDLNPRALELARITTGISEVDVDLRLGSLYEPVAGQTFDLIVSNPPYVIGPPSDSRLIYREGTLAGDELVRQVVCDGAAQLNEDGLVAVLANWAILADQPWDERLAEWITPTGCDALVLQRERLDPYEYIEIWLADAGLVGTPGQLPRYRHWLDYFDRLGIEAVGMGWLFLHRSGRRQPRIRVEEWPHAVHQPVGAAVTDFFAALPASDGTLEDLLAGYWQADPELVQETLGRPGAADPQHLVLRQQYGFGRALEPGTALAAVVGASDGELPLGRLIAAVADLMDVAVAALTAEILPAWRRLVEEGYVHSATGPQDFTGIGQPEH